MVEIGIVLVLLLLLLASLVSGVDERIRRRWVERRWQRSGLGRHD
jgi:hypothetical protein